MPDVVSIPSRRPALSSTPGAALVDGNERLGWLATAVFLELNGVKASRASNDDVNELVVWVAASNPNLDDIANRLRRVIEPNRRRQ
jgi:prophage maintenance system killer protein